MPRNLQLIIELLPPSFPCLLNDLNDRLLPYFVYFCLMFRYGSCIVLAIVSLQNCSCLVFVSLLPLCERSFHFQWNEGTDETFLVQEKFYIFNCASLDAPKYLNLHLKLRFPAICSMQKCTIFCPSGSVIVALQVTLKQVNFYHIILI